MTSILTTGRVAQFNHCDLGLIDVQINSKSQIENFYMGDLKVIHMQDARSSDAAQGMRKLIDAGHNVTVFIRTADLVGYLD